MDDPATRLSARIASREATVCIIGLGYVGLPLVSLFVGAGFRVLGFDTDPDKVAALSAGRSYIRHVPSETIAALAGTGRFEATGDAARLEEPDAILICVPTPLTPQREPEMAYVVQTAEAIAERLRPGQLVVLESTTWPGTTAELVRPILERSGLACGREVFLAYSPEREDPGNPNHGTGTVPKIVGADDDASLALAIALYDRIAPATVPVRDTATAEAVKLAENVFRAVNIALANELKQVLTAMGIDVWEVIRAAATKPFGYMPFWPGPGLGGHCIPVDPFYLAWKARAHGVTTRFIELAGEINRAMPDHVVDRLAVALNDRAGRALKGSRILLIGLAYKRNVDDMRESPALRIIDRLEARGAIVSVHDPHIAAIPRTRAYGHLAGRRSVSLTPKALREAHAVLVVTDHEAVDWRAVGRHARLIVDTRDVLRRAGHTGPNLVLA